MSFGIRLHVWGDRACFTRPEMKVERVSYDVITPSARAHSGGYSLAWRRGRTKQAAGPENE